MRLLGIVSVATVLFIAVDGRSAGEPGKTEGVLPLRNGKGMGNHAVEELRHGSKHFDPHFTRNVDRIHGLEVKDGSKILNHFDPHFSREVDVKIPSQNTEQNVGKEAPKISEIKKQKVVPIPKISEIKKQEAVPIPKISDIKKQEVSIPKISEIKKQEAVLIPKISKIKKEEEIPIPKVVQAKNMHPNLPKEKHTAPILPLVKKGLQIQENRNAHKLLVKENSYVDRFPQGVHSSAYRYISGEKNVFHPRPIAVHNNGQMYLEGKNTADSVLRPKFVPKVAVPDAAPNPAKSMMPLPTNNKSESKKVPDAKEAKDNVVPPPQKEEAETSKGGTDVKAEEGSDKGVPQPSSEVEDKVIETSGGEVQEEGNSDESSRSLKSASEHNEKENDDDDDDESDGEDSSDDEDDDNDKSGGK